MAGALFFICMFLITVCGLFLFKPPVPSNTITDYKVITEYSKPAAVLARQEVVMKMARFLEKNPEISKQERLTALPLSESPSASENIPDMPPSRKIETTFQGANLQFRSPTEYNQWIYKNVTQDAIGFLKQLRSNDNPELYLDTLKKVSEMDSKEETITELKAAYLEEAKNLFQTKDGFHQQMTAKAIQAYLNLEKDLVLGKKIADEILNSNNKPLDKH